MLQRQIMFKQLQELQRQQQLLGFGDSRQQNFVNQQSLVNKKVSGGQISPLINGTPIRDPTQMFMFDSMNFGQHASSVGQGFPNELVFSQGQSQAPRSMGLVSQQSKMSSYGSNLDPTGNNLSHFSHLQVMSVKENSNQAEKNLFGQAFSQGLDTGVQPVNAQQVNNLQRNASSQPFGRRSEQDGWHELFSGKSNNVGPSQGLSSLDPLEQKILFNMDDNSWDASFGKHDGMRIGGFDETYENTDSLGAFPSLQSGSWSALMQSAVAEASSSDTGLEEEWSGLSFQNSELSNDNQPSKFVETGKQPANWLHNNFQNASNPTSKPGNLFNNPNSSSTFPGFQHSRFQQKEDMRSESSHESIQQSPKKAAEWLGHCVQHKQFIEESESHQRLSPLPSAWVEQSVECLERDAHNTSAYHSTAWVESESYRHIPDSRQLDGFNYVDTSVKEMKSECMSNDHSQLSNSPRGSKAHVGEYNSSGNASSSAVDFEKGCVTGHQGNFNASKEAPPSSDVGSGVSAFNDRSAVFHASHITGQTSENMLELLNKVDNSTAYRAGMHFGSTDSTLIPEPPQTGNSDASAAQLYNQASASQYFGLRLAPPTQKPGTSNYVDSPRIPRQSENSKAVLQGPQYERNQLQNQFSVKTQQSQQLTLSDTGSRFPVFTSANSEETSHLISADPHHQQFANYGPKSTFQPPSASATSQQLAFSTSPPNVWIDVSSQENTSPMEVRKFPSGLLTPSDATKSGLGTALGAIREIDNLVYFTRENNSHHIGACAMNSQGFDDVGDQPGKERSGEILDTDSQEQKPVAGYPSEANAVAYGSMITSTHQYGSDKSLYTGSQAPAISVKDLEAFGRSLKHSRVPSQQYSLLNQLHSVKNEETYIPLETANSQLNSSLKAFPESLIQDTCQETLTSVRDDSQSRSVNNILISNETQRSQVNFPLTSSINNYGTLKDGQKFPIYEARVANSAAQQFSVRKPFESFQVNGPPVQMSITGASQASGVVSATSVDSATVKHLSSPFIQNSDVNDQHMVALRPKKRKFSTFEVLPWHKEVTQGSFRLEHLSVADLEWAEAVNRLPEKLKDDVGMPEGLLLFARPKKRLMMTTQLMQQLFRPAPAIICLGDATLNCDIMTFFVSRLALGDACSLASHYSHMPCEGSDLFPGKRSTSRSISDQKFSKIVKNFFNWSKRLEGEFFRLEKGGSILDMKVEFQDLEKFALINRFAKFHIRGQVSSGETKPSATTSNALKVFPQRYVIAVPMPKTVPEEAQCISL